MPASITWNTIPPWYDGSDPASGGPGNGLTESNAAMKELPLATIPPTRATLNGISPDSVHSCWASGGNVAGAWPVQEPSSSSD